MRFFYTIGIYLYTLGIRVAALCGHKNARLMVHGWKESLTKQSNNQAIKTAWFHAASLGEFEQARPVLEAFRERHPDYRVLVSFFSPSGYEVRKNYAHADRVIYLPMDTPRNVRRLLDTYHPTIAFFVKYEFWYNYLGELKRRNIPTYIFSSIFRPNQYFFKWYGGWFRRQLKHCFAHLFVQNEESLRLLQGIGIEHCSLAGDTRFDRVHQIATAQEPNHVVEAWLASNAQNLPHPKKVLVCGSTWPPDEEIIKECVNVLMRKSVSGGANAIKLILAPHIISEEHLRQIERLFPDSVRYSVCEEAISNQNERKQEVNISQSKVLIIDNIGLLSRLYRYAHVAYIGGGFGSGIHNILEAVTFGKPVLFGPNYRKFKEAHDILANGGGFTHSDAATLQKNLSLLLTDDAAYNHASQACKDYMNANLGSTGKILGMLECVNV